jgi:hypothetical protein
MPAVKDDRSIGPRLLLTPGWPAFGGFDWLAVAAASEAGLFIVISHGRLVPLVPGDGNFCDQKDAPQFAMRLVDFGGPVRP